MVEAVRRGKSLQRVANEYHVSKDRDIFVEEFLAIASDVRHVVEYVSVLFAECSGLYPFCNGSSSCDGEQGTEDERNEERFDRCFEFAVESFGDGLEKFEGGLLSLLNHGSPFWSKGCSFKQSYTTKGDSL